MTKKRKSNKILSSIAVALFAVLSLVIWLPGFLGLQSYYVETDSMAPLIPKGSMAYIKPVSIDEIVEGEDVLLFSNQAQTKAFMHRVIDVDNKNQLCYTKGDANKTADLMPTSFSLCRGRVVFSVPFWGYVAQAVNTVWGKIAIALFYVIWLAVEIEHIKSKKKAVKL